MNSIQSLNNVSEIKNRCPEFELSETPIIFNLLFKINL